MLYFYQFLDEHYKQITSQNPWRERSNIFAAVKVDGRFDLSITRIKSFTICDGKSYHLIEYDDSLIFSLFIIKTNEYQSINLLHYVYHIIIIIIIIIVIVILSFNLNRVLYKFFICL